MDRKYPDPLHSTPRLSTRFICAKLILICVKEMVDYTCVSWPGFLACISDNVKYTIYRSLALAGRSQACVEFGHWLFIVFSPFWWTHKNRIFHAESTTANKWLRHTQTYWQPLVDILGQHTDKYQTCCWLRKQKHDEPVFRIVYLWAWLVRSPTIWSVYQFLTKIWLRFV